MKHTIPAPILSILWVVASLPGAAQFQALIVAEEAEAYRELTNGAIHEGAVRLIELMRETPGDDPAVAEELVGPSQLLCFAIYALMTWPDRSWLLQEVFRTDEYPSDKLLLAFAQAGSGVDGLWMSAYNALMQLAKTEHEAFRVGAMYILGDPYFYRGLPEQNPAVAELVLRYPDREFSRHLIEMPVYYTLDKAAKAQDTEKYLLEDVLYWGGLKEAVLNASPGLAKAAEALPSMNYRDLNDNVVRQWAEGLTSDPNPRSRYTIISMLAKTCNTPERRAQARGGLAAIADLPPRTPDVLRARMLLAEFARADHDPQALLTLVTGLLRLNVLPCTPERNMYEAVMQTAQHAGRYFTRHGWHAMAIQVHETLAGKFPRSVLAEVEFQQARAIRVDGLKASLDLIAQEMAEPMKNQDMATLRARYHDIIAHTANDELKAALMEQLAGIEKEAGSDDAALDR